MKIYNVQQRTEKWLAIKAGKFSASNFHRLITPTGKPSSQAEKYIRSRAKEIITGEIEDSYIDDNMRRGNLNEPKARELYEFVTGHKVRQVGFIEINEFVGCSPDGLIDEDGGLEIKCPKGTTQLDRLLDGYYPQEYLPQIQGCLYVTGRKWWDFISYYPKLPPILIRIERDEEYIAKLRSELDKAVELLKEIVKKIGRVK